MAFGGKTEDTVGSLGEKEISLFGRASKGGGDRLPNRVRLKLYIVFNDDA